MLEISVVADTAAHLPLLRAALNAAASPYHLTVLDTDLGSLCHFRNSTHAPDLVLVNGELPFCEVPEFLKDLLAIPIVAQSRILVMGPLAEDLPELARLGVASIPRKPIKPEDLKPLLDPA